MFGNWRNLGMRSYFYTSNSVTLEAPTGDKVLEYCPGYQLQVGDTERRDDLERGHHDRASQSQSDVSRNEPMKRVAVEYLRAVVSVENTFKQLLDRRICSFNNDLKYRSFDKSISD